MGDVIEVDFTPQMHIEVCLEHDALHLENDYEQDVFNIDYEIRQCLFGYEALITADWREKPYYLPEFFKSEIIAAAEAETHRLEELSKVEKLFDGLIIDTTEGEYE